MMPLIPLIMGVLPLGWPDWLRKAAAWVGLIVTVVGLLWAAKAAYDASVIDDHEDRQAARS